MDEKSFFITTLWSNADRLMKALDKKKVPYLYICEWGVVSVNCQDSDLVKLVVDVSDNKQSYIATLIFWTKVMMRYLLG